MLGIRRILFPTDFSDGAARAFPHAAFLADQHDAELHIVNVMENERQDEPTLPTTLGTLREWLGSSTNSPDLDTLSFVQKQIHGGVVAERLLAYAEDEDVDLVVMGTHGRRGVRRMLLGSVTEEVVRMADCPVLTVRSDAEEAPSPTIRRVLVPVDFSDASRVALLHGRDIAQTFGAKIHLLHVVEEVVYPSAYGVNPPLQSMDKLLSRLESTLGEMARVNLGSENVTVRAIHGYAPLSILEYAEGHDVDLIVIATHGRSGFDRFLLGSVAERVLRRASKPVFVVKPGRRSLVSSTEDEENQGR